jgi:UDP-N-acetylmuramate dehydrogenase
VRQVVILNHARAVRFGEDRQPPRVWAESGANFGLVARQAAQRGFAGLEWAAGIPGTVGGAVAGNAGAHGGDTAGSLLVAEILHYEGQRSVRKIWTTEQFEYAYRTSILKRYPGRAVVLDAGLRLERSTPEAVGAKLDELVAFRRRTQPPGASMGSMFKIRRAISPTPDRDGRTEGARVAGRRSAAHRQLLSMGKLPPARSMI